MPTETFFARTSREGIQQTSRQNLSGPQNLKLACSFCGTCASNSKHVHTVHRLGTHWRTDSFGVNSRCSVVETATSIYWRGKSTMPTVTLSHAASGIMFAKSILLLNTSLPHDDEQMWDTKGSPFVSRMSWAFLAQGPRLQSEYWSWPCSSCVRFGSQKQPFQQLEAIQVRQATHCKHNKYRYVR